MRMIPEAELVRKTYILREMDFPPTIKLTKRSCLRWFALSFGLISEKETRTTMLDVLDALLYYQVSKKHTPTTQEIQSFIAEKTGEKVSEKLLRYHLKRLLDLHFIKRQRKKYSFNPSPNSEKDDVIASFNFWISNHLQKHCTTIEGALGELTQLYK